jgi:hypothetical protein
MTGRAACHSAPKDNRSHSQIAAMMSYQILCDLTEKTLTPRFRDVGHPPSVQDSADIQASELGRHVGGFGRNSPLFMGYWCTLQPVKSL